MLGLLSITSEKSIRGTHKRIIYLEIICYSCSRTIPVKSEDLTRSWRYDIIRFGCVGCRWTNIAIRAKYFEWHDITDTLPYEVIL